MAINKLHNLEFLKSRRKELRSQMTPSEAFLWNKIKNGQLDGRKFRRQHSIGKYVVDFYCPSEKLAIELDGMHHFNEAAANNDLIRTEYFNEFNIHVLRFENAEVFDLTDEVLTKIRSYFKGS